jgi:hypothetical protein
MRPKHPKPKKPTQFVRPVASAPPPPPLSPKFKLPEFTGAFLCMDDTSCPSCFDTEEYSWTLHYHEVGPQRFHWEGNGAGASRVWVPKNIPAKDLESVLIPALACLAEDCHFRSEVKDFYNRCETTTIISSPEDTRIQGKRNFKSRYLPDGYFLLFQDDPENVGLVLYWGSTLSETEIGVLLFKAPRLVVLNKQSHPLSSYNPRLWENPSKE